MIYVFITALFIAPFFVFAHILTWLFKQLEFWKTFAYSIYGFVIIICILRGLGLVLEKKILFKDDYYGEYIINRDYFKGPQTNWQYDHYRFKITEQDSILFYETEGKKIIKTYKGIIRTSTGYNSQRLKLIMKDYHQVLNTSPTTYRSTWDFYLVFNSMYYGNMYFKKGKWEELN